MRMRPSQSTVMNRNVGSHRVVDDVKVQAVPLRDRCPVMHPGTTEWIDAQAYARAADHVHVDDVAEIADVSAQEVVPVGRRRAQRF